MESSIQLLRPLSWALNLAACKALSCSPLALVFLVVHLTGTGSDRPLPAVPRVTEPVADQSALTPDARRVANAFVMTAVARQNTGA